MSIGNNSCIYIVAGILCALYHLIFTAAAVVGVIPISTLDWSGQKHPRARDLPSVAELRSDRVKIQASVTGSKAHF